MLEHAAESGDERGPVHAVDGRDVQRGPKGVRFSRFYPSEHEADRDGRGEPRDHVHRPVRAQRDDGHHLQHRDDDAGDRDCRNADPASCIAPYTASAVCPEKKKSLPTP